LKSTFYDFVFISFVTATGSLYVLGQSNLKVLLVPGFVFVWMVSTIVAPFSVLLLLKHWRKFEGTKRFCILSLGVGFLFWLAAETMEAFIVFIQGAAPYLSLIDSIRIVGQCFMIVTFFSIMKWTGYFQKPRRWIFTISIGMGLGLPFLLTLILPMITDITRVSLESVIVSTYTSLNVVILCMSLGSFISLYQSDLRKRWSPITIGFMLFVISDITFIIVQRGEVYAPGHFAEAFWIIGKVMIAYGCFKITKGGFDFYAFLGHKRESADSLFSLAKKGEVAVATYTSAADKMKIFSAYIREGIERGERIQYICSDEDSETVRAKLKEYGVDVEKHERNGTLFMESLTEYYLPDGHFDIDRAVEKGLDLRAEAKRKGYKRAREIFDVGDFSFINGQWQKYLEYWDDSRWGTPPGVGILYGPFITELTVFNVEDMSKAQVSEILKTFGGGKYPQTRFIDVLEYADAFSKRIDMPHQKLLGRKFLLEFDPTSDYERAVEDFAKESMANVEPIFIFTSKTSSIHSCLAEEPSIKFFLTSISTSTPKSTSENTVLLPAKNAPLILDALNKVLETQVGANICVWGACRADANVCFVFDILSELLTTIGREKTFTFLRYALDMLSSKKTTSLFLLNTGAHKTEEVSRLRNLFSNQLAYDKNGLEIVKTS